MRPRRQPKSVYRFGTILVSKSAIADLDAVALRGLLRSHLRGTELAGITIPRIGRTRSTMAPGFADLVLTVAVGVMCMIW